jgi:hypothetical protein
MTKEEGDMMNLNRNPTKEELQTLLAACDDGEGIHVLWVERMGEVQITLLLTETDVEWIKGVDDEKVQFHYKSYAKNDGFVGKAASVDDMYIVTLFEKLLRDWQEHRSGFIDDEGIARGKSATNTLPLSNLPGADLVLRRMRALENKYWLEAMILADLHIETQLRAISGINELPKSKSKRTGKEVINLAKQMAEHNMIGKELYEKIRKFNTSRSRIFQNFVMETISYEKLESMAMASENLIVELKDLEEISRHKDGKK